VHLIRASLRYVNYRDRKKVASALRPIYTAPNADAALAELGRFDAEWGQRYPPTVNAWRANWEHVIPFLALPDELRARGLHDQHDRGPAPPGPQGDQDPRPLPRRTGDHQAHLPRHHARRRQMAAQPHLDSAPRRAQESTAIEPTRARPPLAHSASSSPNSPAIASSWRSTKRAIVA
jgi:hypothetical protein